MAAGAVAVSVLAGVAVEVAVAVVAGRTTVETVVVSVAAVAVLTFVAVAVFAVAASTVGVLLVSFLFFPFVALADYYWSVVVPLLIFVSVSTWRSVVEAAAVAFVARSVSVVSVLLPAAAAWPQSVAASAWGSRAAVEVYFPPLSFSRRCALLSWAACRPGVAPAQCRGQHLVVACGGPWCGRVSGGVAPVRLLGRRRQLLWSS